MKPTRLFALLTLLALFAAAPIAAGKDAPGKAKANAKSADTAERTVDFMTEIKPIFESACIHCHGEEEDKGDLRMHKQELVLREGEYDSLILKPGDAEESSIYWTIVLPDDDDLIMPPKKPFLNERQKTMIKTWINEGAHWPKGVVLQEVPRMSFKNNIQPLLKKGGPFNDKELYQIRLWAEQGAVWDEDAKLAATGADDTTAEEEKGTSSLDLVKEIHEKIVAETKEQAEGDMVEYTGPIPDYPDIEYTMVPIPGGTYTMGSPDSEANRNEDEGPQVEVKIEPFWMGKYEVSWDEYLKFMLPEFPRNKDGTLASPKPDATIVELIGRPTEPYQEMSFGMGQDGYPAICMTHHAANQYCAWLSAQTGHFYRVPTEAEWEYACRAGTTTAYSFGDDPKQLDDYAWYFENSDYQYQPIGEKKPNPWGLHDMHGNVLEIVLDQYAADFYKTLGEGSSPVVMPWNKATLPYPQVVRGGSWDDDPEALRSAVRRASSEDWKNQDPQLPKSIWYHTDAVWLGMRIVRPLKVPSPEEMHAYWYSGVEYE